MSQDADAHTFVFADLAGYTALTEAHGDDHAADEAAEFCEAVRGLLPDHGAEEVKAIGDAVLLRASDPAQAAGLAERIVCGYGARHRGLGVRVGLHTGTAVRRGDDWFGSAVNVASRVADAARAGEVLCTEATRDAIGPAAPVRDRGQWTFKNLANPVTVYEPEGRSFRRTPSAGWPSTRSVRPSAGCITESSTSSAPTAAPRPSTRARRRTAQTPICRQARISPLPSVLWAPTGASAQAAVAQDPAHAGFDSGDVPHVHNPYRPRAER
jgi:adenylate cyclase